MLDYMLHFLIKDNKIVVANVILVLSLLCSLFTAAMSIVLLRYYDRLLLMHERFEFHYESNNV